MYEDKTEQSEQTERVETRGRKRKEEQSEQKNICDDCFHRGTKACTSCVEYKKENEVK